MSTTARDALAVLTHSDEVARNLYEAVREALRGRGSARREAQDVLLDRVRPTPARIIPLVLAVRDELVREDPPPRGLAGRVDALLLALADCAGTNGSSKHDPSGRAKAKEADAASNGGRAVNGGARAREGAASRRRAGPDPRVGTDRAGRLLRNLLDVAPDAVLTIRVSGRVGIWNAAGAEITGWRRRDLERRGARSLFKNPDEYDALLCDLERGGDVEPREAVLECADGDEVTVRVFAAPLDLPGRHRRDSDRFLLFLHDLTEVHRIRKRLIDTEKLSAMAKIAGSVAHEFRNPLNSLFLSADLLEDELSGRSEAEDAIAPTLTAIREEIERLNEIINHYLALSKVESSEPETVDLGETVGAFAEEWRERAAAENVELRVRVAEGDLDVTADPNQVRRVLVNLVENAFDALGRSESGDDERPRTRAVTFAVRPMRRTVKLTVRDTGPGIPEELRERVFEPFFTSRSRGSGLGLYLVREIVLAHGGAISLAGNGGRGTSVAMHWPRPEGGGR